MAPCHVETVQQTARDQELDGDLTWRGGHESARCSSNRLSAPVECSQFVAEGFQLRILHFVTQKMHTYEICSRKDKCSVNLISDALPLAGSLECLKIRRNILQYRSVQPFLSVITDDRSLRRSAKYMVAKWLKPEIRRPTVC
jgi:hypothetical protein